MQQEKRIKIGFNENLHHSSPPSEHMRHANITHSLIPNLKKDSKKTQPPLHSANLQCQSPTSRNGTYPPSQHTIHPCHAQDSGTPAMSRDADVSCWPAVIPCSAPQQGCPQARHRKLARFARRSEWGYAVVVTSHHTSTASFALWRRVGAASQRERERWPAS